MNYKQIKLLSIIFTVLQSVTGKINDKLRQLLNEIERSKKIIIKKYIIKDNGMSLTGISIKVRKLEVFFGVIKDWKISVHNKNNQQKAQEHMQIRVAKEEQILQFFKQKYGKKQRKIYAHYSSDFGKIITEQYLMLIPIDQRMAVRAHGVFDVLYIKKCRLINLESHISRLLNSAYSASIEIDMTTEQIKQIVLGTARAVLKKLKQENVSSDQIEKKVLGVRVSISSGHGDFGIASLGKNPVLYVSVFQPYINYDTEKEGVSEFVVKIVPSVNNFLIHAKTINYVENAIMANDSKRKGGYMGIKALQNGVLLEAAVANIAFIFGKQFATPRVETVIEGTTLKKLLLFLEQLIKQGILQKISFRDITVDQAINKADEMMVIGGDKIVPVLNFSGKQISKIRGPITNKCQVWYEDQIQKGENTKIEF